MEHLIKFADLKQESYRVTRDIEKYTDAAIFYNHAISIIKTHEYLANKLDMTMPVLSQCMHESIRKHVVL